jgi:hypothetical protein
MRRAWPARFRARFGDAAAAVAPRIVVARTPAAALLAARERLGRAIGEVKHKSATPGPEGVLVELGD